MKKIILGILIISLIVLSGCKECIERTEPYNVTEEYTEQEAYQEEVCDEREYKYEIENVKSVRYGDRVELTYDFVNLDKDAFEFRGGAEWVLGENAVFEKFKPEVCCAYTVAAGETVSVEKEYDEAPGGLWGRPLVIVPMKTGCEMVTKYRDVTKTRVVTKYRNVTCS